MRCSNLIAELSLQESTPCYLVSTNHPLNGYSLHISLHFVLDRIAFCETISHQLPSHVHGASKTTSPSAPHFSRPNDPHSLSAASNGLTSMLDTR
jgi:hypothetical protein